MSKKIVPVSGKVSVPEKEAETVVKTVAEKIWDEIKDLKLEMFALPNQSVSACYKPLFLDPVKLHLARLTAATAALPALELAIMSKFTIEQADRYVIVTPISKQ